MMFERTPTTSSSLGQSTTPVSKPNTNGKPKCDWCLGPHTMTECKWKPVRISLTGRWVIKWLGIEISY